MCLGIPGKITEIYNNQGLILGKIDFGGVYREVCLEYVPDAKIGDYVLIHVGFALSIISEEEANITINLINDILNVENTTYT